jgi:hypothetical protein
MRVKLLARIVALSIVTTSCATAQSSSLLGLSVGLVVGAGAGAAAGQANHTETKSAAIGAAVGAALGALMGYLAHRDQTSKAKLSAEPQDYGPPPSLTKPVVRRVWVPDKVESDKLVRGHFIYVLEKPSGWTVNDDHD